MIGAALLSHHRTGDLDNAVKAVTLMVDSEGHTMTKWTDYYALFHKPTYQTAEATRSQIDLAEQVEKKHSYHFSYPRLLRSAFTHPSYPFSWERIPCYQRLEFLGDSLLDMACVNFLFHRFPDRDPQWLTEHKVRALTRGYNKGGLILSRWPWYLTSSWVHFVSSWDFISICASTIVWWSTISVNM